MSEYLEKIINNLNTIETEEAEALAEATKKVAEVIKNDGLIFTFGCGHSHLPGLMHFTAQAVLQTFPQCSIPTLCFTTVPQNQAEWRK